MQDWCAITQTPGSCVRHGKAGGGKAVDDMKWPLRKRRKTGRDTDTLNLWESRALSKAPSGPMTAATPHTNIAPRHFHFLLLYPPFSPSTSVSPPSRFNLSSDVFMVQVKWPPKLRGGAGHRGAGRLFWGHDGSLRWYLTWRQQCCILYIHPLYLLSHNRCANVCLKIHKNQDHQLHTEAALTTFIWVSFQRWNNIFLHFRDLTLLRSCDNMTSHSYHDMILMRLSVKSFLSPSFLNWAQCEHLFYTL